MVICVAVDVAICVAVEVGTCVAVDVVISVTVEVGTCAAVRRTTFRSRRRCHAKFYRRASKFWHGTYMFTLPPFCEAQASSCM